MKFVALAIVLPMTANADILTNLTPFIGSSSPDYDLAAAPLAPSHALADPVLAPYSPGDSDFGVQQVLGTYRGLPPVQFFLGLNAGYTDNAPGQVRALDDESYFLSGRIAASWQPRIAAGWFADIGAREDFFRFESNQAVDFETFQPHIGVAKSFTDLDDLLFFSRYEYQRITNGSWSDSSYSAHRIRTGLQKNLFLRSHQQLSAGIDAAFDIDAGPRFLERNVYTAMLNYTYWINDSLSTTLSWSGSLWDFNNSAREDWRHVAGLEVNWHLSRNCRLSTSVFYSNHDSNTPFGANDIEAWQSGIGFDFNYSF